MPPETSDLDPKQPGGGVREPTDPAVGEGGAVARLIGGSLPGDDNGGNGNRDHGGDESRQ